MGSGVGFDDDDELEEVDDDDELEELDDDDELEDLDDDDELEELAEFDWSSTSESNSELTLCNSRSIRVLFAATSKAVTTSVRFRFFSNKPFLLASSATKSSSEISIC